MSIRVAIVLSPYASGCGFGGADGSTVGEGFGWRNDDGFARGHAVTYQAHVAAALLRCRHDPAMGHAVRNDENHVASVAGNDRGSGNEDTLRCGGCRGGTTFEERHAHAHVGHDASVLI